MHPDLEKLLELQKTDAEVARLKNEIAALPKRVAEIETKLAGNLAAVEKAKAAAKTNDQNRRKYEGEIQVAQQKISKYRDQMLAVKTNEEYRALGNEIKFSEDAIRALEDKILECMVESEDLDRNIKLAEMELAVERADVEKEKNDARSRTAEDEAAVQQLLPRRAELRSGISDDTLRHYDRVMKQRGSAIAEVRDQICLACRVMLRPQVYNEVRTGEHVLFCDSCGRIFYYDRSQDEQPQAVENQTAGPESSTAEPAGAGEPAASSES